MLGVIYTCNIYEIIQNHDLSNPSHEIPKKMFWFFRPMFCVPSVPRVRGAYLRNNAAVLYCCRRAGEPLKTATDSTGLRKNPNPNLWV